MSAKKAWHPFHLRLFTKGECLQMKQVPFRSITNFFSHLHSLETMSLIHPQKILANKISSTPFN